jgi:hypothetical protein
MKEATISFMDARECIRDLWNQHYRHLTAVADPFDVIDCFKVVRRQILIDFVSPDAPAATILVRLNDSTNPRTVLQKRMDRPQVVTWVRCDSLQNLLSHAFSFVDFFDFAERDHIDLRYVETTPQDGSGSRYLFEVTDARFLVTS